MSAQHFFSTSLFNKLFKLNMVSRDGYVKVTDTQLIEFKKYLKQEYSENTAALYKRRKEMVDEVLSLLDEDKLTLRQYKRMIILLYKLNMKVTEDGLLESVPPTPKKRNSETSKPKLSIWEKKMEAEERRLKVLKRDLKLLDNWLLELSNPKNKVLKKYPDPSASGDAQHEECRRTIRKIIRNAHRNVTCALKESDSELMTEECWEPEDSSDKNCEKHSTTESYPTLSLDELLAMEERRRKISKNATKAGKSSKTREDFWENDTNQEDLEEDNTERPLDKNANWEDDIKSKVFKGNSLKKKSGTNELLTHVHDVTRVSSFQMSTDSDESLIDVLHFFPVLQRKVFEDETSSSNDDEDYSDDFELEGDDVRILSFLDGDGNDGNEMTEDPSHGKMELSLDEILREEREISGKRS